MNYNPLFSGHFEKRKIEKVINDFGKEIIIKTQFERTSNLGRSIFRYKGESHEK